jgi:hypothetical protein
MHDGIPTEASWRAHLLRVSGRDPTPESDPPPEALRSAGGAGQGFDVGCWAVATGKSGELPAPFDARGHGPLHAWDRRQAIEVWTEIELSAMHALWRRARLGRDAAIRGRLFEAVAWHLEHTQPDNATNRPWALHVFLRQGSPEARHYAATLLHNAQALQPVPEPLAAWILMDAACELGFASDLS